MNSLLSVMNIQSEVLPDYLDGAREALTTAAHYLETRKAPYAFLVKRQTFTPYVRRLAAVFVVLANGVF